MSRFEILKMKTYWPDIFLILRFDILIQDLGKNVLRFDGQVQDVHVFLCHDLKSCFKVNVDIRGVFCVYSALCIKGKYINLYIIGELI